VREVDRALEPGQVPDVLRDGAGEAVEGEVKPFKRGELGAEPGGERAREVVPRERERAEPAAFEDRRREGAVDGVGGEVDDLEVGQVTEVLGELAVERVPVEDEALERGRPRDELGWDGPEEAVAAEVEVAERGRERGPRERGNEALLREGERDDAAGLGGAGVRGGAGDPVQAQESAAVASQLDSAPVGSCRTAALNTSSAWPSGVSASAAVETARRRSRRRSAMASWRRAALGSLGLRTPGVRRKGWGWPLV